MKIEDLNSLIKFNKEMKNESVKKNKKKNVRGKNSHEMKSLKLTTLSAAISLELSVMQSEQFNVLVSYRLKIIRKVSEEQINKNNSVKRNIKIGSLSLGTR